jgi:hypothetical protein
MTQRHHECKAIFCTDGWLELREVGNTDAWIASDSPEWVTA